MGQAGLELVRRHYSWQHMAQRLTAVYQEGIGRHQALAMLTTRLEKIWYGYQVASEADFRDSLTQLETLGCHLH